MSDLSFWGKKKGCGGTSSSSEVICKNMYWSFEFFIIIDYITEQKFTKGNKFLAEIPVTIEIWVSFFSLPTKHSHISIVYNI